MSTKKLPTVAIVGQTNVGKSSLFNRLVGFQQAIVAREAGTTRDRVVGKVVHKDHAFWLVDTAGLKEAEDEFEATIQEQIEDAVGAADVIMMIVDATVIPTDEDRAIAKKALKSRKPVLLVVNKTDKGGALPSEDYLRLGIKHIYRTSAEQSRGVMELLDALAQFIPPARDIPADNTLRIALVGRPNVGKSYLVNTLAGKQEAIVANVAGTTRDINRVRVRYHNRDIEILDTAGIRRSGKIEVGIEKFSVLRSLQAIEEADVCLLLMDANELNVALDQKLAGIIKEAGKGLVLVVSKWDSLEDKTPFSRDEIAARLMQSFHHVPWAPLIFTSAVTGQNVAKLFDITSEIDTRRKQQLKTAELNKVLQKAIADHPPAGLKNTHPKLRYMVQTDTNPPWFVVFGSNLQQLHWGYKRYLERTMREQFDYIGTPIKFSFKFSPKEEKEND
ncbi:MAG TPA: ribosome biogenesis GTPase Der [Candidatus Saccharimonadales bacterium]|nr:ribosome biogenesis GTPase Der [Candidatus Saccharimonadales bacterium]